MRIWVFLGFGLTVAGCWLMVEGIRNRFDLLDSTSQDLSKVSFDQTVDRAYELTLASKSGTIVNTTDRLNDSQTESTTTDTTKQDPSKLSFKQDARVQPTDTKGMDVSDFKEHLLDNSYHKLLISTLIESGWESSQLKMLSKYLNDPRAEFLPEVLKINATHVEKWEHYSHHLTEDGFEMCDDYWGKNHKEIKASAKKYNFPPEIILGILKVETNFGKYGGTRSVFNVFWSLSLGDNKQVQMENLPELKKMSKSELDKLHRRASWARLQLADLLFMAKNGGENPVGIMGSWAGAFGLCQFIPTSYRAYGRDGDNDNVVDLDNIADASASIANYLKENHWPKDRDRAKQKKSIMRYNHSEFYADCVLLLADGIVRQWKGLEAIE